jgi:Zn-dependent alcohol dehydrogenase
MTRDQVKGKAACLVELGKPLEMIDIEYDLPVGNGLVLVENSFTTICGSQVGEIEGRKGKDPYLPHLLGHESVGIVRAIGSDVHKVKEGDTVVLHWMKGSGAQVAVPSLNSSIGFVNSGSVTTFSEYSLVSENRCTPINSKLDSMLLPLFGCSVTTAYGSLINDSQVKSGESLLVLGLGPIGIFTLEMGKFLGLNKITGIDRNEHRVDIARKLGFHAHLDDGNKDDTFLSLLGLNNGSKLHVIDTTGNVEAINKAYEYMKLGDSLILVGVSSEGQKISLDPMPLHFGTSIKGSFGGGIYPDTEIPKLINLAENDKFRLDVLGGEVFELIQINEAITKFKEGSILKAVIQFNSQKNAW